MTELGATFANIAETIVRLHGFGSNKMYCGYNLYELDNYEVDEYSKEKARLLDRLVEMGYLRKFTTQPYKNNKGRNWRYRFVVKKVCFGLTSKGWEVAPKYLAILARASERATIELKAKSYFEKMKDTNTITFEKALEMAQNGIL